MSNITMKEWAGIIGLVALIAINLGRSGMPRLTAAVANLRARHARDRAAVLVSNDAGPPAEAVAWVERVVAAAGGKAAPDFILQHLLNGSCPALVMQSRIEQLEAETPTP